MFSCVKTCCTIKALTSRDWGKFVNVTEAFRKLETIQWCHGPLECPPLWTERLIGSKPINQWDPPLIVCDVNGTSHCWLSFVPQSCYSLCGSWPKRRSLINNISWHLWSYQRKRNGSYETDGQLVQEAHELLLYPFTKHLEFGINTDK